MSDIKWCIEYLKKTNDIKDDLDDSFTTFRALLNITIVILRHIKRI